MVSLQNTQLVKCSKCAFAFHNNIGYDTCPRCGGQINPNIGRNIIQGSSNKKKEELSKVLRFGVAPGSSTAVVATIDKELVQTKVVSKKNMEDISKVLEFTGHRS